MSKLSLRQHWWVLHLALEYTSRLGLLPLTWADRCGPPAGAQMPVFEHEQAGLFLHPRGTAAHSMSNMPAWRSAQKTTAILLHV